MYIIYNAIKNLARNKGRNILLAAVTLAIIMGAVVALTIHSASSRVIDNIRLEMGSRVTIEQDIITMFRTGGAEALAENMRPIPLNDYIRFADSAYLSKTIFGAEVVNLTSQTLATENRRNPMTDEYLDLLVSHRLVGTSNPNYHPEMENLEDIIIEGRMFEALNEVVVDNEFARRNGLSIGSVFDIETLFFDIAFELTVVGIYSYDDFEYGNLRFIANLFTGFDTIAAAAGDSNEGLSISTAYYLRNPDYLESFENEVRAKGLPDTYIVSINQAAFDRVSGPMIGMQSAVMTFSFVILILGAIVLALVSFLVVRERKYEVGVLRAMGMKGGKVALGILTEAVAVTILCLVVGLGAGSVAAQPIANSLLESRVVAANARAEETGQDRLIALVMYGGQMQTEYSVGHVPESEIVVGLSGAVVMQIFVITLGLAALSGIVGVVVITRYEPLKILRERG